MIYVEYVHAVKFVCIKCMFTTKGFGIKVLMLSLQLIRAMYDVLSIIFTDEFFLLYR